MKSQIDVAKAALRQIAKTRANSNSEPDVMGAALDEAKDTAERALGTLERRSKAETAIDLTAEERDLLLAAVRLWQAWQCPRERTRVPLVAVDPLFGEMLGDIAANGRPAEERLGLVHLDRLARRLGGA